MKGHLLLNPMHKRWVLIVGILGLGFLVACRSGCAPAPTAAPETPAPLSEVSPVTETAPEPFRPSSSPSQIPPSKPAPVSQPTAVPVPGLIMEVTPVPALTLGPALTPLPTVTPALAPTSTPATPATPQATPAPTPASTPLPASSPGTGGSFAPAPNPTLTPTPPIPAQQTVDIALMAAQPRVAVGEQFSVRVIVNAGPASPVDAAQVYLDFDSSVLQVIAIRDGTVLGEQLQSSFDNGLGQVNYAAGTLGNAAEAPFTLTTIDFQGTGATGQGGTDIVFAPLTAPRQTKAVDAGLDNTGKLTPVNVVFE